MFIAWTTVAQKADAQKMADAVVCRGLAACVQIDGPVLSTFGWQDITTQAEEYRLCFKCTDSRLPELETYVLAHHPYEMPEWIVVRADRVGEKYLSWAEANSTNPPL